MRRLNSSLGVLPLRQFKQAPSGKKYLLPHRGFFAPARQRPPSHSVSLVPPYGGTPCPLSLSARGGPASGGRAAKGISSRTTPDSDTIPNDEIAGADRCLSARGGSVLRRTSKQRKSEAGGAGIAVNGRVVVTDNCIYMTTSTNKPDAT